MKKLVHLLVALNLLPLQLLAYAEQADVLEVELFCLNAQTVLSEKFDLKLNLKNCLGQNVKVEIDQFFHQMIGIVVAEQNSNQQVQALTCSMEYGGLPSDNDITGPMVCTE